MSIRKTGIVRWHGSGFSLRKLKKENKVFCLASFIYTSSEKTLMRTCCLSALLFTFNRHVSYYTWVKIPINSL